MVAKETRFNDRDIIFTRRLKLKDSSPLLPLVCTSMVKIATGADNYFSHITVSDIEEIQRLMCEYIVIKDEKGEKRPLTLLDLDEGFSGFIVLLAEFFEFNFGLFSQAQSMIAVMTGRSIKPSASKK